MPDTNFNPAETEERTEHHYYGNTNDMDANTDTTTTTDLSTMDLSATPRKKIPSAYDLDVMLKQVEHVGPGPWTPETYKKVRAATDAANARGVAAMAAWKAAQRQPRFIAMARSTGRATKANPKYQGGADARDLAEEESKTEESVAEESKKEEDTDSEREEDEEGSKSSKSGGGGDDDDWHDPYGSDASDISINDDKATDVPNPDPTPTKWTPRGATNPSRPWRRVK